MATKGADPVDEVMKDISEVEIVDEAETSENTAIRTIDSDCNFLERAVERFDSRFTLRALRSIPSLRKKLSAKILFETVASRYKLGDRTAEVLIRAIKPHLSSEDGKKVKEKIEKRTGKDLGTEDKKDVIPEIDIYLAILIQVCTHRSH